jgi:tellurite resistance protein
MTKKTPLTDRERAILRSLGSAWGSALVRAKAHQSELSGELSADELEVLEQAMRAVPNSEGSKPEAEQGE